MTIGTGSVAAAALLSACGGITDGLPSLPAMPPTRAPGDPVPTAVPTSALPASTRPPLIARPTPPEAPAPQPTEPSKPAVAAAKPADIKPSEAPKPLVPRAGVAPR